jgi:hypothetical protein
MTQKKDLHSFGNLADMWTKLQYNKVQKHLSIAFIKTSRLTKGFVNHDWKNEAHKLENIYHTNRAIYNGASNDLPYKTLVLLGKMLGEKSIQCEIQQFIKSNVIKYKGEFIKLDDLDKQAKIRKILRTYEFDQLQSEDIAA